jgi:hypothetical protein
VCRVVRVSLATCIMIRISATLSDMSDGLITVSKRSNSTFIMFTLAYEDDVEYFVVNELLNIKC